MLSKYDEIKDRIINDVLSRGKGVPRKAIFQYFSVGAESLFPKDEEFSDAEIQRQIKKVLKSETESPDGQMTVYKKGGINYYKIRVRPTVPNKKKVKPDTDTDDTLYIGRGGEYAILSELLFAGYNANIMTVDEGVDIVASKDNKYYYIQVKTTYFDSNGRINAHIPIENFHRVAGMETIYIIVVRENNDGRFSYFIFQQNEINNLITEHRVEKSETNINIKIEFNEKTKEPMFYTQRGFSTAIAYTAENKKFKF